VIVHLDTSVLIDALSGPRRSLEAMARLIDEGHRLSLSTIVLYEWLRGTRTPAELSAQEELFPPEGAAVFGPNEARLAARLSTRVRRARGREVDLAIAACALTHGASMWTLNPADFQDIPDLRLVA
jgi:predicted nucleic acid-binding protein